MLWRGKRAEKMTQ